jgi:phage shock protein C
VVLQRYFKGKVKWEGSIMSDKTLALSNDKMVFGVCGGIAEYFGWSAGGVRLVYVLLSVLSAAFPGLFVYIVLWLLMPKKE